MQRRLHTDQQEMECRRGDALGIRYSSSGGVGLAPTPSASATSSAALLAAPAMPHASHHAARLDSAAGVRLTATTLCSVDCEVTEQVTMGAALRTDGRAATSELEVARRIVSARAGAATAPGARTTSINGLVTVWQRRIGTDVGVSFTCGRRSDDLFDPERATSRSIATSRQRKCRYRTPRTSTKFSTKFSTGTAAHAAAAVYPRPSRSTRLPEYRGRYP